MLSSQNSVEKLFFSISVILFNKLYFITNFFCTSYYPVCVKKVRDVLFVKLDSLTSVANDLLLMVNSSVEEKNLQYLC